MSHVSRRTFALGAAALAAVPVFGRRTGAFAGQSPSIRLGLASYTFRAFTRAQLITSMEELGVSFLNAKDVKDHLPADSQDEAQALRAYSAAGISLRAAGALSLAKLDEIESKFQYCKRAGVPVLVGGDPAPENLPTIEKFARQYDIRVAIHNHGPEDKRWHSPLDVLQAVAKMDERLGCCLDVGHTVRAGVNVVDAVRAVGPRLFNVHMKDLANVGDKESQVAVGQGMIDIAGIFKALRHADYKGYVDLEYEIEADNPMPGVTSSFAYMRKLLSSSA